MTCSLIVIMLVIQLTRLGLMSLDILRWRHKKEKKEKKNQVLLFSNCFVLYIVCLYGIVLLFGLLQLLLNLAAYVFFYITILAVPKSNLELEMIVE